MRCEKYVNVNALIKFLKTSSGNAIPDDITRRIIEDNIPATFDAVPQWSHKGPALAICDRNPDQLLARAPELLPLCLLMDTGSLPVHLVLPPPVRLNKVEKSVPWSKTFILLARHLPPRPVAVLRAVTLLISSPSRSFTRLPLHTKLCAPSG